MDTAQKNSIASTKQDLAKATEKYQTASKDKPVVQSSRVNPLVSKLTDSILESTYTRNQLRRRMRLLKDYINFRLYQSTEKLAFLETISAFLTRYPLYNQDAHWISSLGEEFYKNFRDTNSSTVLRDVNKYLDEMSVPVLYLPFALTDDIIDQKSLGGPANSTQVVPVQVMVEIGSWFKTNVSKTFIFEPSFSPDLVGGCALSMNGTYHDFSLRISMNEHHEEIIKSLKGIKK
ncbi:hypothetical protein A2631_00675 [Candidatus Daviesbacteria bacterium RIFCSPHIGHO2_01_FULL_44_29]|uniref:Uncharacterized protein n=1 Tax=Candidatus Daviesbacteria bacterium RIFCSPHIGHO2_02_FULL_43_12 TaxID=1797776 RepID=A0A1F5KHA9_9BACT|nr:MAG: hypothetical protein A2631_00675 [Candidatus Daviesbacteria bacterium RIFCSPHIGHO2_01_FULL_44_29]OGE40323.1 MAG: hypothetical protein A3D25_02985 [Candidatus Daviesbacteria bacterium RIFCSPHIGHO2_02_FULL_43_12]OGE69759.1 MAG: hypothetical protein A3B55_02220 [Candidatus Daviesbacteria bacterium RIFCSPLOWO2_01_FULL_43_15]